MRLLKQVLYIVTPLVIIGFASRVYGTRPDAATAGPVAPPPPTVSVAQPIRRTVEVESEWVGQVDSPQTVELRARVEGFLKEISFNDGTEVEAGKLLFVIDPAPYEVALRKAQAQLQTDLAALSQARDTKQIEVHRANVERLRATLTNAKQVAKDYRAAFAASAISREQMDQAETSAKEAAANLASEEAALTQAESDYEHNIARADASVAVSRAGVTDAELSLSYTRVYAPMAGRIGRAEVKIGALVGKAEPTLLATISQVDPVWVYFSVSEREAFELRKLEDEKKLGRGSSGAMPLKMVLDTGAHYPFDGKLNYMSRTVDAGTGTIALRAEFPNPSHFLRPGNYARIRAVITERPDALLVSERAIGVDQAGKYLLVVNGENRVERRNVSTGVHSEGEVVIENGLKGSERVVVNGLQFARPGSTVNPVGVAGAALPVDTAALSTK